MTQKTTNPRQSMHWMRLTVAAALSLSLVACSTVPTQQDQTAIGVGTGAVIGGALGNVIGKNTDGTVIGAAIGGLIGGIVGHNYEDKKAEIMRDSAEPNAQVIRDANNTDGLDMVKMADGSMRVNVSGDAGFNTGSAVIRDGYLSTLEKLSRVIRSSGSGNSRGSLSDTRIILARKWPIKRSRWRERRACVTIWKAQALPQAKCRCMVVEPVSLS